MAVSKADPRMRELLRSTADLEKHAEELRRSSGRVRRLWRLLEEGPAPSRRGRCRRLPLLQRLLWRRSWR